MQRLRTLNHNAERLQLALTRLAELDQQAEREKISGKAVVEISYQHGVSSLVRTRIEASYKVR